MMYCLRCGSKVEENQEYCPHCGANIKEELDRYNYIPKTEEENTKKEKEIEKNLKPSHEDQYQYSIKYSYGNDEDLIKAYIGKNYEKFKKNKFSLPTFFFGPLYFFYRKLYILGLFWIIAIAIFWPNPIFLIMITVALATTFSSIYVTEVKRQVKKIKQENKNLGDSDLLEKCSKKGGVNHLVFLVIIPIILVVIGTINFLLKEYEEEKPLAKEENYKIGNISYTIPKGFVKSEYETDTYKFYSYIKDFEYCSVTFDINNYDYLYEEDYTMEMYLKEHLESSTEEIISTPQTITINNEIWTHINKYDDYETEDIYILKKNNKFYEINTSADIDSTSCKEKFQKVLNSLTYKE